MDDKKRHNWLVKEAKIWLDNLGCDEIYQDGKCELSLEQNVFGHLENMTIRVCVDADDDLLDSSLNSMGIVIERVYPEQGLSGMASFPLFKSEQRIAKMRDMTYQEALKAGLYQDFHEIE